MVYPNGQAGGASGDGAFDDVWVTLVWTTGTPPPVPSTPRAGLGNLDDVLFSRRYAAASTFGWPTQAVSHLPADFAHFTWSDGRRDALNDATLWLSMEMFTPAGQNVIPYFLSVEGTAVWDDNNLP